jgi:divalent metal cation (Fe/Co/Zn/Cd) transporter
MSEVLQRRGYDVHRAAIEFDDPRYAKRFESFLMPHPFRARRQPPEPIIVGAAWLTLTAAVMVALAYGKADTGRRLGNPVLETEARITLVDGALALAVLVGVVLNAAVGWWWADPLSALVLVAYGVREARHAWQEARPR